MTEDGPRFKALPRGPAATVSVWDIIDREEREAKTPEEYVWDDIGDFLEHFGIEKKEARGTSQQDRRKTTRRGRT